MNDFDEVFKETKENELIDENNDNHFKNNDIFLYDFHKKKRGFSFLKWFKKNKNSLQLQSVSAESTPTLERKKKSSCESLDTIFSTQTVRSFAYIPSISFQPSAPPSELLDFNKYLEENNNFQLLQQNELNGPNLEIFYNRKKKRKAPSPPKLNRKNSLPIVLQREKTDKEFGDCIKTCHRRTVSDSFKDKEKPIFRHVQGKRKAPQPPIKVIPNSNFQKVTNDNHSIGRKKKAAPPPPSERKDDVKIKSPSNVAPNMFPADTRKKEKNSELYDLSICDTSSSQNNQNVLKKGLKKKTGVKNQSETIKSFESPNVISASPLASRPWYKRSTKNSQESGLIKNYLTKGIEKRRSKKDDDWMPDGIFSMKNLLLDTTYNNKLNIFLRLEKNDDKKKEEKRKSQISILTNISELDREAAEILKKEQAEEKRIIEANDAKFYKPNLYPHLNGIMTKQEVVKKNISENENQKKRQEKEKFHNTFLEKSYENPIYIKKTEGGSSTAKEFESLDSKTEIVSNAKLQKKIIPPNDISDLCSNKQIKSDKSVTNFKKKSSSSDSIKCSQIQQPNAIINTNLQDKIEKKELDNLNGPWICKKCTLENAGWRVFCEICSSVKPHLFFNSEVKAENEKLKNFNLKHQKKIQQPIPQLLDETKESDKPKSSSFSSEVTESLAVGNTPSKEKLKIIHENTENLQLKEKPREENIHKDDESVGKETLENQKPENYPKYSEIINPLAKTSSLIDKLESVKKERKSNENGNVAEAYIITTTTILEDVIIKKGNKTSKDVSNAKIDSQGENIKDHLKESEFEQQNLLSCTEKKVQENLNFSENNLLPNNQDLEELSKKLNGAQDLADLRTNIEKIRSGKNVNIDEVKGLLRKLEKAINNKEQSIDAALSNKLAHLIISLKANKDMSVASTSGITVYMHVEDKVSHRGPFEIQVLPHMTLLQLKKKVYKEFGFPTSVQRWILGKELATEDNKTLESHGIKNNFCSLFLYLVAPDKPSRVSNRKSLESIREVKSSTVIENKENIKKNIGHSENNEKQFSPPSKEKKSESRNSLLIDSCQTNGFVSPSSSVLQDENSQKQEDNEKSCFTQKENDINKNDDISNQLPLDLEKTKIKFIPRNSVKQKVEQIDSFSNFHVGLSEKWKCVKCDFVNSSERLNCFNCKSKKINSKFTKSDVQQTATKNIENEENLNKVVEKSETNEPEGHYKALIELEESDLVPNVEPFNCPICFLDYSLGEGIILKNCLHIFCRPCLINTIKYSEDAEVKCPFMDMSYSCTTVLQEREIKALVPKKIYEIHLAKSIKEAESTIENAFHCKTLDCKGWCIYEDNVNEFYCPVCKLTNCLTCQAIHTGINCREYQEKMTNASETDFDAKKTKLLLEEMVEKGEAMICPKCQVVLMKKWGCDWLKCSMCKTEICWVTRGFRWGPAGKGDTSGGCKCGVKGIKCHPKCNYCH